MNTNKNELSINEMEQVSGGSIIAAVGLGAVCVGLVVQLGKACKKLYNDITSD